MNCSICDRITGTGKDHVDCVEKRRIEMEDQNFKLGKLDDVAFLWIWKF